VQPAEVPTATVVERLNADREAIDADIDERASSLFVDRRRVALDGHLEIGRAGE
jgi:hypothetical protein